MKIEQTLKQTILNHRLIDDGDRVLVGLSGGKDSMALLRLLALRSRIFNPRFSVEAAYVRMRNIPYDGDVERLRAFCDTLGVTLHVAETGFDPSTDRRHTPCYLCSLYRRRTLFRMAEELGCHKLALGHHLDDVVHTALLNLIQQGTLSSFSPRMEMDHYRLTIIRPLFFIREDAIRQYIDPYIGETQKGKPCPYDTATQRHDVAVIRQQMERLNPDFAYSMLHALGKELRPKPEGHDDFKGGVAKPPCP